MKTEMTEIYVYLRKYNGFSSLDANIDLSMHKMESCDSFCYALVQKMEIPLPVLSDEDKDKLLSGAELESLHAMKERLQAETHRKLCRIDDRIQELLAIEDKTV